MAEADLITQKNVHSLIETSYSIRSMSTEQAEQKAAPEGTIFIAGLEEQQKNHDSIPSEELHYDFAKQDAKRWGDSEQEMLLHLHNELGNRWTAIAASFPGRDHNSVKNFFYAQIRKSLRRLNFFIKKYFSGQFKQLNINHVSKMITVISDRAEEFDERTQEIQRLKRFFFSMSKKQQKGTLSKKQIAEMSQFCTHINTLLEKVSKQKKVKKSEKAWEPEAQQRSAPASQQKTSSSPLSDAELHQFAVPMNPQAFLFSSMAMPSMWAAPSFYVPVYDSQYVLFCSDAVFQTNS